MQDMLPLFWGYELTGDKAFLEKGANVGTDVPRSSNPPPAGVPSQKLVFVTVDHTRVLCYSAVLTVEPVPTDFLGLCLQGMGGNNGVHHRCSVHRSKSVR